MKAIHYSNIADNPNPFAECLRLIETYAPRMMRVGGGGITRQQVHHNDNPRAMTRTKAARVLELAREGSYSQTEIALAVGCTQSGVSKLLAQHKTCQRDGRRTP